MFRAGHAAGNFEDVVARITMVAAVAHANAGSGSAVENQRPLGVDRGGAGQLDNHRQDLQVSGNPTINYTECHPLTSDECLMGVCCRRRSSLVAPLSNFGEQQRKCNI